MKTISRIVETVENNVNKHETFLSPFLLKVLNGDNRVAQRKLASSEARFLEEAASADYKTCNIRLREGEYQYSLAKAIASFQLELCFPDVKDIIGRLYGEEETNSIRFVRKIQTILKKMEKSNIVRILPKMKPWDLQRYALLSFRFEDVDKNSVVLATDEEIKQAQDKLHSVSIQQGEAGRRTRGAIVKVSLLTLAVGASYAASVWALLQPIINPIIFISAFFVAVTFSLLLGKALSRK